MKQLFFFATPADVIPVLRRFESNIPIKFVEMGTLNNPNRAIYLESLQIPNPGIATHETGSLSQGHMVSLRDVKNHMEVSTTKKGETRWNLFSAHNEDTVCLNLAGLWKTGTLLPGNVVTMHSTPVAQQLMKWFLAALQGRRIYQGRKLVAWQRGVGDVENW